MAAPAILAQATGSLDVWSLVMHAGPMAKFVLLALAFFSVTSWGILAERFRTYRTAERESAAFLEQFRKGTGLAQVHDATAALTNSPVADVFRAGFREISLNPSPAGGPLESTSLEALERVLRKNSAVQLTDLERTRTPEMRATVSFRVSRCCTFSVV